MKKIPCDTPTTCPKCGGDLRGHPIPEKDRHQFGGATHFSRVIGRYDKALDRTIEWICPLCAHTWERPPGHGLVTK